MSSIHEEVRLSPHQEAWEEIFQEEKKRIRKAFDADGIRVAILHVGSTSVKSMIAKPIIDILVCPEKPESLMDAARILEQCGYKNLGECGREVRFFFSKGEEEHHSFYLHLCDKTHPVAKDQVLFRYLERNDPVIFQNYYELKLKLAELYPDDRNMYRMMKGFYIQGVLGAYRLSENENRISETDDNIDHWVYEFVMPQETEQEMLQAAVLLDMTMDQFAQAAVANALNNKEETMICHQLFQDYPEFSRQISLTRYYPVLRGESEEKAKLRKLLEEKQIVK